MLLVQPDGAQSVGGQTLMHNTADARQDPPWNSRPDAAGGQRIVVRWRQARW